MVSNNGFKPSARQILIKLFYRDTPTKQLWDFKGDCIV
jgi:hypothetical protein